MKRIAVVEDNPDNMLLIHAILDDIYDIDEYETGRSALDGLRENIPCLVLLDISLPGMDGVQILSEIRKDDNLKNLPVIALTAHAMTGDKDKYIKIGFNGYVSKPIIDEYVLINTINELLK